MTRYVMHGVPEWRDGRVVRVRYFGTITGAKKFATDQAATLGHRGYTINSFERAQIARLLTEHAPLPDYYVRKAPVVNDDRP